MVKIKSPQDKDHLARRVRELRAKLHAEQPQVLAAHTGATYIASGEGGGEFSLLLWGNEVTVVYPDFVALNTHDREPLQVFDQALLMYYFSISNGIPESGRWISFSELPDGRFYNQAYQRYTGSELGRAFGVHYDKFTRASDSLNGQRETLGDDSFSFRVLPRVSLLAVCWHGDEDFKPSYQILFDSSVSHHLSTDACAILGNTLTRKLIRGARSD